MDSLPSVSHGNTGSTEAKNFDNEFRAFRITTMRIRMASSQQITSSDGYGIIYLDDRLELGLADIEHA